MVNEIISGKLEPSLFLHFLDGDDRGLRIERVDDRLEQEQIDTAVEESA